MDRKVYLRVDGIHGLSHDPGHIGEVEISQFGYRPVGESPSKKAQVWITMPPDPAIGAFLKNKGEDKKLKDATLTMESWEASIPRTLKAEMKGLKVTEVIAIGRAEFIVPKDQTWPLHKISFLVDTFQYPQTVVPPESTDQWNAS